LDWFLCIFVLLAYFYVLLIVRLTILP
jgi:hypothetical protein